MKRITPLLAGILLLAVTAFAQEEKKDEAKQETMKKAEAMTMSGYVVDAMCAKGMAKKKNVMEAAAKHTKACALEEECAASGYGIFSDGKWYKFDEAGDRQAKEWIEKTELEKGLMITVSGTMEGDMLMVSSISDYKVEKPEKKMESKEEKHEHMH
jgi:hypothetical protein